jgi:hypothetical protein
MCGVYLASLSPAQTYITCSDGDKILHFGTESRATILLGQEDRFWAMHSDIARCDRHLGTQRRL